MSTKIKPHTMWALYNYGRLMNVEHYKRDLANLFIKGKPEMIAYIKNGSITVQRVRVSVIRRIPKKRKKS
jgi:hypothetical protein